MSQETTKRLVLGFDGGCSTCAEMAQKVQEKVGDKLEVINLRDPRVLEWRKEALGENAPWAPTLFEVNGEAVKAWTGRRMGLKLARALGPAATWRVMQVVGEVGATPQVVEASPVARIGAGMSRGQFLKGVGGAAVAMGVLSVTGKLSSPAQAASSVQPITGDQLVQVARRVVGSNDMINVAGPAFRDKIRRGGVIKQCQNGECITVISAGNCRVRQVNGTFSASGDCEVIRAVRQPLEGGNSLLGVSFANDDRAIVYYEYEKPVQGVNTEAAIYRPEGKNAFREIRSQNGGLDILVPEANENGIRAQAAPCGGCSSAPGSRYLGNSCRTTNVVDCVINVGGCGLCATSCLVTASTIALTGVCLGCLSLSCGLIFRNCCDKIQGQACLYCGAPR